MNIMFDVGANWGTDSLDFIRNNNDWVCFAFEPTPQLFAHLVNASAGFKDRYFVYPYAISDFVGKANFNVAGQSDWGCSSLLNFIPDTNLFWKDRYDFKVTDTLEVDAIRLDTFIKFLNIEFIDYFHCDVQGMDLTALESFGNYISIVKEGQIEVSNKKDVLYTNSNNYVEDAIIFLEKHNFSIKGIYPNDIHNNEANLVFINKLHNTV